MTVDETVRRSLWFYFGIFKSRADVLHHLFYVIGNGYEWKNGELVDPYEEDETARHEERQPFEGFPDLMAEWEGDRRYNRENIDHLVGRTGALHGNPYPPSDYAHIHHIPSDVKPDWMAAAQEIKAIVEPLHEAGVQMRPGQQQQRRCHNCGKVLTGWRYWCDETCRRQEDGLSEDFDSE